MRIAFYASDKPREHMLAAVLKVGAATLGDEVEIRRTGEYGEDDAGNDLRFAGPSPDTDVACVFGVKGKSLQIMKEHRAMGRATLYFDKGYTRAKGESGHTLYSRISVNAADPLAYMMRKKRKADRLERLDIKMRPRVTGAGHVLLCTSSQKYCDFHGLGDAEYHAAKLILQLRKTTPRQVVYRPKPSTRGARPLGGASFSHASSSIYDALRGCHAVVTHGATAAMDAIFEGVPAIVLGNGIARPVAETAILNINEPRWPTDEDRHQWACCMAYTQWTADELRSGEAWSQLRHEIVNGTKM